MHLLTLLYPAAPVSMVLLFYVFESAKRATVTARHNCMIYINTWWALTKQSHIYIMTVNNLNITSLRTYIDHWITDQHSSNWRRLWREAGDGCPIFIHMQFSTRQASNSDRIVTLRNMVHVGALAKLKLWNCIKNTRCISKLILMSIYVAQSICFYVGWFVYAHQD